MFLSKISKLYSLLRGEGNGKHQYCTVPIQFRRWAKLGKCLGFFPVAKQDLHCYHPEEQSNKQQKIGRCCRFFSWSFLLSLLVFIFFSTSILQPLNLYISVYVSSDLGNLRMTSTDKFSLQAFLMCVHVIRGIAPIFPVIRVGRIMSAVRQMAKYDGQFKVAKGSLCFLDFGIVILCVGSILVLMSNYIVTQSDFVDEITSDDDPIFPLSYLLTESKLFTTIFVEAGHVYAEFAICFVVATMRYISKFIENRMQRLEEEMRDLVKMETQSFKPEVEITLSTISNEEVTNDVGRSGEKLRELVKLLEIFNKTFQGYILGFFVFTVVLLTVSIYMVFIIIRVASVFQGFFFLNHTKVVRGFNALGITGVHSIYRMILLVNVGDRIQNAGKSLLATVSLLDGTQSQRRAPHKTLKQMRWMLHGTDFAVKPWSIFTLNRQMILSVLGSVVTFVVVLIQFRVTDPDPHT